MDWINIVQMAFGGGVVAGIVEVCAAIRHRKADKVKAEAEAAQASASAKTSDIEAQRQEIDLMKYMRETMAEWMTQTEEGNKKNFANQDKIMEQLTRMNKRLDRQDELLESLQIEVNNQKTFLDGPYTQWLAERQNAKHTNRYGNAVT
jgi:hypothetical protein